MQRSDFTAFFQALWGYEPRPWQVRLLDAVLNDGKWPTHISAPTGSGKSAVIDVHVFVNALAVLGQGPRVPRRMAVCVNRRALVDQHEQRARDIAQALQEAESGVLKEVHDALLSLVTRADGEGAALCVLSLRGGVSVNREWIHDPSACSVIAVTPDMWGSRALFSGYGSAAGARPREAGLLVMDTVLVLDEAHLNRQLALLCENLMELSAVSAPQLNIPSFQYVATTATPDGESGQQVGVVAEDLEVDEQLAAVLTRPKPVEYVEVKKQGAGRASDAYIRELVTVAERVHAEQVSAPNAAPTTGVIVNRVDTATRVAAQLRQKYGDNAVVCWVGRMRPMDVQRIRAERPNLLTPRGEDDVLYLVATQTVEVGVDLDLAGLVTELASGSALAQRAGRVNRRGLRECSPIAVVGPIGDDIADYPPYAATELTAAYEWLTKVASSAAGLTPWAVAAEDLRTPSALLPRASLTSLVLPEAKMLAETSRPPFQQPDLSFWLRDSLQEEVESVSVVMRKGLFADDSFAIALLRETPPVKDEMFPTRVKDAREIVGYILDEESGRAFLWEQEGAVQLSDASQVKPGDVVILDARRQTVAQVLSTQGPYDMAVPQCLWEPTVKASFTQEPPYLLVWQGKNEQDGMPESHRADSRITQLIESLGELSAQTGEGEEIAELMRQRVIDAVGRELDMTLGLCDDAGQLLWVVLREPDAVADEPDSRQTWSPSGRKVTLDAHSQAVADRARFVGEQLGLAQRWIDVIDKAGLAHDLGKSDRRFQQYTLGNKDADVLLAKSGAATAQQVRRRFAQSPLPRGWRHEQLSAAIVVAQEGANEDVDVIARLSGTSHGHGRPFFPHDAAHLLPEESVQPELYTDEVRRNAHELFDTGAGWQDLLASSEEKLGLWGIAYLEAVLRSADCMASKEGS